MTLRPRRRGIRTNPRFGAMWDKGFRSTEPTRSWWEDLLLATTRPTPLPHTITTTKQPETTTSWWPPGVNLGPRPPRTHLPLHIINPKAVKWGGPALPIWFSKEKTIKTYAPEIVNYPITFNWSIPRHLRVDKYTSKPDWPLNSPLFGSQQIYDYLEDVSLPPPPISGETEYPITSPAPWWTFPPWWEKKIADEINGTTLQPRSIASTVASQKIITPPSPKITTQYTAQTQTVFPKIIENKSRPSSRLTAAPIISTTTITPPLPTIDMTRREVHHSGPWWKLTIVENPMLTSPIPTKPIRIKRFIQKNKPLTRHNAFRLRKNNKPMFMCLNEESKLLSLKKYNYRSYRDLNLYYSKLISRHKNVSDFLRKDILKPAINKLEIKKKSSSREYCITNNNSDLIILNKIKMELDRTYHLTALYKLLLSGLKKFQKNKKPLPEVIFVKNIYRKLLENLVLIIRNKAQKKTNFAYRNRYKLHLSKSKILKPLEILCKRTLINKENMGKAIVIIKTLYEPFKVYECKITVKPSKATRKLLLTKNKRIHTDNLINEEFVNSHKRIKRENPFESINLNHTHFNLSPQSMEKVVDDIVNELPLQSIENELKSEALSELLKDRLKKLGKTNINKEVISKMVEFEVKNFKIEQETKNLVKKVILKLLNEVISTLRNNVWMKDAMIKLFEEGYSVDSVIETMTKEISVQSLLDSMKISGVNVTTDHERIVLSQFKNYKTMLNKMLRQEVLLWEYQLSKNSTHVRKKRDVLPSIAFLTQLNLNKCNPIVNPINCKEYYVEERASAKPKNINRLNRSQHRVKVVKNKMLDCLWRNKRDIHGIGSLESEVESSIYDRNELDIEKELSAIEKSPISDHKKKKKLMKRLKWLQTQTENPDEIIFPDDFEDQLMRTEKYDEKKNIAPRPPRPRYQWNVRTKKPTLKVMTFLSKISLTRGKPFVPLTTTESSLIIPQTFPPTRRKRTRKPDLTEESIELLTTVNPYKKHAWLHYTPKPVSQKFIKQARSFKRQQITMKYRSNTFGTLKTFQTMKFGKRTQQPVISLQEFLKRRNEFRRVKEEGMWNKKFLTSSGDADSNKNEAKHLSEDDITEEDDDLSFDTKLSGEVKAADFTLRPMSDFLFTKPITSTDHSEKHNTQDNVSINKASVGPLKQKCTTSPKSTTKVTRKRFTKKTGYTRLPKLRGSSTRRSSKTLQAIQKPSSSGDIKQKADVEEIGAETVPEVERNKRDISTTYSLRPFTLQPVMREKNVC